MILVSGIRVGIEEEEAQAAERAASRLKLGSGAVRNSLVVKVSVDARRRDRIALVYTMGMELAEHLDEGAVASRAGGPDVKLHRPLDYRPSVGSQRLEKRPVVVGFGPAGMFAGLLLARYGYRPLILERGQAVGDRIASVERFWRTGELDESSNVQFGEGGAGTFSDGKLTTRISDPRCGWVLRELVRFGAPAEILHRAKPHIGTDRLRGVVKAIRMEIQRLGGEVRFSAAVEEIDLAGGRLRGLTAAGQAIAAEAAILAVGHSARDTFHMLIGRGLPLEVKPFSVGVRIEHLQSGIDRGLFGAYAGHPALGRGEYQLSYRENGRAVYTFCMCPGGTVVPSASEAGGVVVNGMSEYARDGRNANAALVVSVDAADFGSRPLEAIAFQRALEQAAYHAGGGGFRAPVQTVGSFLGGTNGAFGQVEPTYALGVRETDFGSLLPPPVTGMLRTGLQSFGQKLNGFAAGDALLTGVETRTSSPVRIPRGENGEAFSASGLYPCGEGAGYAGGIMSAAVDGLQAAEQLLRRYRPLD